MLVKQHLCMKPYTIPFGLRILGKSLALLKLQVPYFKNWGSKWPYVIRFLDDMWYYTYENVLNYEVKKNTFLNFRQIFWYKGERGLHLSFNIDQN